MAEQTSISTPTLYFNSGVEDKEAYELILQKNIPCNFEAPVSFHDRPYVRWGFREFRGIEQIRRFVVEFLAAPSQAA